MGTQTNFLAVENFAEDQVTGKVFLTIAFRNPNDRWDYEESQPANSHIAKVHIKKFMRFILALHLEYWCIDCKYACQGANQAHQRVEAFCDFLADYNLESALRLFPRLRPYMDQCLPPISHSDYITLREWKDNIIEFEKQVKQNVAAYE